MTISDRDSTEDLSGPGTALVLGGAGGIGAAIAARVSRDRPTVITYRTGAERAERICAELSGPARPVRAVGVDLTTSSGVTEAFDRAEEAGPIEVVVDCVGGWDFPRLTELTDDAIDQSLSLNLRSAILILREAARRVVDGGRIVMISSAAVALAPARQVTYVAAKAGLEGAARVAAKELASRGVTVNVVRPGSTDTETLRRTTSERAIEAMSKANAFGRLGTPEDIAGAVALLISPDAAWVTGQVFDATGGLV